MSKKFIETEKNVLTIIENCKTFKFKDCEYTVLNVGKPKPNDGKGEPKTDVYVLAESIDDSRRVEFKISVKQKNADFLENKLSLDRAKAIFGKDTQEIIEKSIVSISDRFYDGNIFFEKKGRVEKGSMTIGWKFELLNKVSGKKSGLMDLNSNQKIDIYSGTNLSDSKKNSKIKGVVVKNSGIANYIYEVDENIIDANSIFNNILPIDEEYVLGKNIYFACKAINYRTSKDKWDGNRPLSVYLDWKLDNNKLYYDVIFSNPLETKANEIGENIRNILKKLNINNDNFDLLKENIV